MCAVVHGLRVRESTQITHSSTQECGGQVVIGCVCVWSVRRQEVHVKNTNNNMFNIYKLTPHIDPKDRRHKRYGQLILTRVWDHALIILGIHAVSEQSLDLLVIEVLT